MKSANWISQIGRMPYRAAPMPTPMIDNSARGESMIRPGPYFSNSPWVARKTPPRGPTSSPTMNTRSSWASSSSIACRSAWISVPSATANVLDIDRIGRLGDVRIGRRLGEPDGVLDGRRRIRLQLGFDLLGEDLFLAQGFLEGAQRIGRLHRLDLIPRPIGSIVVVGGVGSQTMDSGLDHCRSIAAPRPFHRLADGLVYGQHVEPIDADAGQAKPGRLAGRPCHRHLHLLTHGDGVDVVLD